MYRKTQTCSREKLEGCHILQKGPSYEFMSVASQYREDPQSRKRK
jgi:hypothetical protein